MKTTKEADQERLDNLAEKGHTGCRAWTRTTKQDGDKVSTKLSTPMGTAPVEMNDYNDDRWKDGT